MATIYISPVGSSANSGTSSADALSLASLDKAIQLAGPGGTVILLADQGAYNVTGPVNIYHGGVDGAAVTIMGANSAGDPQNIQINGTRPADYAPTNNAGNETFKLLAGADNLIFENISFANVGCAFRVGADVSNITVQNIYADNVRRFFEDSASGDAATATISGLTIREVEVHGFSKSVIRLQYDTNDVLIQNVLGDSEHQDGDNFAMGVLLDGTVHDVTLDHVTMENSVASSSGYWNGDGFVTERNVYDITFKDTVARGNADGGYDLKSQSTTLVDALAEDNGRNFRIWGEATLINPTGLDPHKQGGTGGQYQIEITTGAKVTVIGGNFSDSGSGTIAVKNGGGLISFSNTKVIHAADGIVSTGTGISGLDPSQITSTPSTGISSQNGGALLEDLRGASSGGTGNETASYAASIVGVTVDLGAGTGVGGDAQGDRFEGIENIVGSGWGDLLKGNAGVNVIVGGGGDDMLDGGRGADVLSGGLGNDLYLVDNRADLVLENLGQGIDEVRTWLGGASTLRERQANAFQLADNVENLTGTGRSQGLRGNELDNVIIAGAGEDYIDASAGGTDDIAAGASSDVIYYGAALTGADLNNGGTATDLLVLQGDYAITFGARTLSGIEKVQLLGGATTSFGYQAGGTFDYDIVSIDANVREGFTVAVDASTLQLGEHLNFNGSAERDGKFDFTGGRDSDTFIGGAQRDQLFGGAGNDTLIGNGGNDTIRGGLGKDLLSGGNGADKFVYAAGAGDQPYSSVALESTSLDYDTITGFNFASDRIDLPGAVSSLAKVTSGMLNDASFDADLAAAIDDALAARGAVLFTATDGGQAGQTFLVVDGDGNGLYQADLDFVIQLQAPVGTPTSVDFFI